MGGGGKGKGGGQMQLLQMMMSMFKGKGKGKRGYRTSNEKKVWIGGFPKGQATKETGKKLCEHMKQAGECTWAQIGPSGMGHATFKTEQECQQAILMLNNSIFEGHMLQVDVWQNQKETAAS
eukprot:TRINITY_DN84333_c0_g1_i1.p1 TRINITY_DN84333_c0_g1~~TRINITY_DN84333_c0_g1_i1.p1  ORF type:complete len:122 (-),score=31.04 TRINITY_DN84333_c0_g1_i1:210-575(-)